MLEILTLSLDFVEFKLECVQLTPLYVKHAIKIVSANGVTLDLPIHRLNEVFDDFTHAVFECHPVLLLLGIIED